MWVGSTFPYCSLHSPLECPPRLGAAALTRDQLNNLSTALMADTMPEIVQGKELTQSADTHHAAYDEPDISHESPERVDEAHQVLEDEGAVLSQEAQYVRDVASDQIKELTTLYQDFNTVVHASGG